MLRLTPLRAALVAAITAGLALAAGLGVWSWQQRRLPSEVRTLQAVLERLSRSNDLGTQPIAFMVGAGTYTAQLAEQRGLCKQESCDFYAQLDPFRHYSPIWDELIRQGYALGDIQGWSASSGTVVIPRAAFRAYGPHIGYLSCTVAHEIAHFRRHHIFEQTTYESQALRGLPERQKQLASLKRSREQELEADRDAADMLARAGYRGRVCQDDLSFMYRSIGDGSLTEPDSTHPGYQERIAAMRAHYDALEKKPPRPQPRPAATFRFDRADNLLTLQPAQPAQPAAASVSGGSGTIR